MMAPKPLEGTLVIDASRMLPGAVLVRMLVDLGARVIKIEEPAKGDLMRHAGPLADGIGAGFQTFFRGVESVSLDLKSLAGQAALRKICAQADVFIESFRSGILESWGLGPAQWADIAPGLITISLSGYGSGSNEVAHDLNLVASSGLLSLLSPTTEGIPPVQLADVSTGMLACSAILAALLARHKTGMGRHLEQPLALGPLPFLSWGWANASLGAGGLLECQLAGQSPAYRLYECQDGKTLALGALEPKFWLALLGALGLPELAECGLATGKRGQEAAQLLADRFAGHPRDHWLAIARALQLPLSPVATLDEAMAAPYYAEKMASITLNDGRQLQMPGPYLPGFGAGAETRLAPALGEGTERVLKEFGFSEEALKILLGS